MDPTTSVAQQALPAPSREIEVASAPNQGLSAQHKLVEYITQLQARGGGYGHDVANPAALGSEALKLLKGYLERADRLQEMTGARVNKMEENAVLTPPNEEGLQNAVFTPGPAEQYFKPPAPVGDKVESIPALSSTDLDRAIQMLSEILSFSTETTFISVATTNVSKSANTLVRGQ